MSTKLRNAIRAINRSTITSVGVLTLAGAGSVAMAQEGMVEEVVVTGIQGSLRQAIDVKRNAAAMVDAISSEDIGKFPDKNIAESLQRVPGVSINRGFSGEGSEVSIRGTNPELTSVLLNGQYVASTGWFSQGANKRSFNMDLMPSEMVDRVEVYKSPTAELDEGGGGGTVVVHTRKPLDLDAMTVFLSADANQVDIDTDETGIGATAMVSWKNDDENFGIMGLISTAETIGRAHKAENYWEESWSGSGISEFNQDRERDTYDLTAQFAPTDELDFSVHYFNSEQDADNTNQNFLVINGGDRNIQFVPGTVEGRVADNGLPTVGTSTGGFPFLAVDINSRIASLETETLHFTADYTTDSLKVSGQFGSTEASGGNGGDLNSLWGTPGVDGAGDPITLPGGATVELNMDSGSFMTLNPVGLDFADGSWQALQGAPSVSETQLTDEEDYAQVDLDFTVEYGPITHLKTGIKVREHTFGNRSFNSSYAGSTLVVGTSTLDQWQSGIIDHSGADGALRDSKTDLARIDVGAFSSEVRDNLGPRVENPGGFGEVDEDIIALYGQADFEGEGFSGNVGMRYVETENTGTRFNAAGTGLESDEGEYSDWLPSMNVKVELSDDLDLRVSASRVMSRPGYSSLSPSFTTFNTTTKQAAKGNLNIEPFRATQGDIGLEWYFAEDALLSGTVFWKDIQSFVTTTKVEQVLNEPGGTTALYTVDTPANGLGGKLQGIEVQYQQNFGNYGVIANYTYVDAEGKAPDGSSIDLPGASENSYNLTGYYENEMFTARLAYSFRSTFLAEGLGIGGSSRFLDQDYLDGALVWHATDNIDVSFEGVNLLGELIRENQGASGRLRNHSDTGTRFYAKVSARF
jgi:iron complex outermembrane receptor protein